MEIIDLGLIAYPAAQALQERLVAEIAAGERQETLLLLEHQPVYTIGSGGNPLNILDPAVQPIRINRGGDITWHGPGQLVGYPLIDLNRRGRDLHRYLRFLEELLIRTVADFGLSAWREPGRTGVWSSGGKLASIGVGVRRWVTMHGFALNVAQDIAPFQLINPCGIIGCPVTSLSTELGGAMSLATVSASCRRLFLRMLSQQLPESPPIASGLPVVDALLAGC